MGREHRDWRRHLVVIGIYTLLALALTWPLVTHFASHVPGDGADDPPLTWNLWWARYALLQEGSNPFDGDTLFYPLGINLAFYTLTLLNGLLSIPLQAAVGLVPASNLLLLSSFVLGAYGTYLFVQAQLGNKGRFPAPFLAGFPAPFLAGLVYAFASNKMSYAALGQWNIASSQWIPFYVLYLFKMGQAPRKWRYALLAALFLLLQAYAELTYASFLVLFTGLWALWQVVARLKGARRRTIGPLVVGLAGVGLIFAIGLGPVLAAMVPDLLAEGDIFVEGGGFADVFSADLLGFLIPTRLHPLLGSLVEQFNFHHGVGQHIYPGYAVLALALLACLTAWRRPGVRFWALSAGLFWLLTLGPSLQVNGHDTGLPLPFALVARLPFFKGNRYPSRYSVLLIFSLAILVAYGLDQMGRRGWVARRDVPLSTARLRPIVGTVLLAVVLLFGHLSAPLPLSDMKVPAIYDTLAAMPGDWTLLDLPVAWRNGFRVTGTEHPIIMFEQYYQTVHHKRVLAGNTSRNPPLKFQYFSRAPVISTLVALERGHTVEPAVVARDRALAAEVLRFFNVQAIVVHPEQTGPEMVPYLEATMPLAPLADDGSIVAYRVDLPPWPDTWTIEPGEELAQLSYAEGWGPPAGGATWVQRRTARLLVPLAGGPATVTLRAYAPAGGQRLRLESNGWTSAPIDLAPGWGDYRLEMPLQPGLNEVWLHVEELSPAAAVKRAPRAIGTTGVSSPVNLVVESAGQETGGLAHIYVDGLDVSTNQRGYNLAVIAPDSGRVESVMAFDTHLDETASGALAAFLDGVPAGRIVAVAAADEASRLLGPEAVAALGSIGVSGDLREHFRWGQALIGVKGAAPGSALEAMDWLRPVVVAVGEGATEPELGVALGRVTFAVADGP